eukprot:91524-Amphidinium_carterae.2
MGMYVRLPENAAEVSERRSSSLGSSAGVGVPPSSEVVVAEVAPIAQVFADSKVGPVKGFRYQQQPNRENCRAAAHSQTVQ